MTRSARLLVLLLCLPTAAAARAPMTVSPGGVAAETTVADPCPTFSWTAAAPAAELELAVYAIDAAGEVEARPVLLQRLPGAALSWTPPLELCLEAGGRYAWSIRALGGARAGSWSEPSLFRVAPRPPEPDLEAALAVVRRHLASSGVGTENPPAGSLLSPSTTIADDRTTLRQSDSASTSPSAATRNATASAGTVGMQARVDDGSEVSFGLYGLSAADESGSAGVVGETVAASGTTYGVIGRHTGGSGAGAAGVFSSLGGVDILLGFGDGVPVFQVQSTGKVSFSGDLLCINCIDGVDVKDSSLTGSDIANGTLTGSDIANGTITGSDIANNSIFGRDIANNTIVETNLANGSVGGYELDSISAVTVECNGACTGTTLGEICDLAGSDRRPVFVACDEIRPHSSGTVSCGSGNDTCFLNSTVSSGDTLSRFCNDQNGWDAIVYCLDDDE